MKSTLLFLITLILCTATLQGQENTTTSKKVSHTFYALGNLGTTLKNSDHPVLNEIKNSVQRDPDNTTILFLGNNASDNGFIHNNGQGQKHLESYVNGLSNIWGNLVFIPGTSDWKSGLKDLKSQENFLKELTHRKNIFLPKNGCPIKKIKINKDIDVLILDSQWVLSDWDNIPNINDHCEIKNKTEFYVAVEHEIVKSQGKTVLIAVHHPIASYGASGLSNALGINPQSVNNKFYSEYSQRLLTIVRQANNVVFLSGHEQNMQYLVDKGVPVIISGAGGKIKKSKSGANTKFISKEKGFAKIESYKDGSLSVSFYGISNNFSSPLYVTQVIKTQNSTQVKNYKEKDVNKEVFKSIYTSEELERSAVYKLLWGEHYREDYATPIKIKTALLDTLYGGLTVMRKGGGHQTNSLRLQTKDGRQFVMRSAKKSALRFIQYFIFKTQYLEASLEENYFVQLLQDYWTTAHPYGVLTVGDLSDALKIYHPNTELYFIPKQNALGIHNDAYGDKIYFIEERVTDGHGNVTSLGSTNKIISTADLLEELRRKDKLEINESLYIRTRLFDNILGDWDRHADQWRWALQKDENGVDFYEPIPRDRDQVYSDFDGFILGTLTTLNPLLRFMQRYDETYNHVKWFNDAGDDVDWAVLKNHTQEDWLREAKYIKKHLTEEVIDKAFENFPKEINQEKIQKIKKALLGRISRVEENAVHIYEYLQSNVIITGTDKKDHFTITRKPNGITNVSIYRVKKGEKTTKFWDVDYDKAITKEIWIYGLDDEDIFEVDGESDSYIRIKIIGGQNNDIYNIRNRKRIKVFDQKSKPNTFNTKVSKVLSDNYDLNTYYFKKNRRDVYRIQPIISSNPDDGLKVGATYNHTTYNLQRNPFSSKHSIKALYISETSGVEASYSGEFANIFEDINFGVEASFSSPSFTNNFFGFGNETQNLDDIVGEDFNRVRLKHFSVSPSLIKRGYQGSITRIGISYENIEAERTVGRFIENAEINPKVFEGQEFFGIQGSYEYDNFDSETLPKSGIGFKVTAGYKTNLDQNRDFGYIIPEIRLTKKIDRKGKIVYATKFKAQFNFGDEFEFYQAASIGDGDGLRGLRQQRFRGKRSFYQNSDVRLNMGRIKNTLVPITYGLYGSFDYGRVWIANDNSSKWHTTPGAGLFFNIAGFTTANIGYFNSSEGGRLNILFSLAF